MRTNSTSTSVRPAPSGSGRSLIPGTFYVLLGDGRQNTCPTFNSLLAKLAVMQDANWPHTFAIAEISPFMRENNRNVPARLRLMSLDEFPFDSADDVIPFTADLEDPNLVFPEKMVYFSVTKESRRQDNDTNVAETAKYMSGNNTPFMIVGMGVSNGRNMVEVMTPSDFGFTAEQFPSWRVARSVTQHLAAWRARGAEQVSE